MMNMQRVRNGEMSERRLRYSPSLMRSIKESEAKNRNGTFEMEDDGLGVRNNSDKKFKIMSDQTARTLSRIREKAGGFLKKNTALSELSDRSREKPDFGRRTEDLRGRGRSDQRPSENRRGLAGAAILLRPAGGRILLIAGAAILTIAAIAVAFAIVAGQNTGVAINGRALGSVKNETALKTIVQDLQQDLSEDNLNAEIVIDEDLIEMKENAPSGAEEATLDREALKKELIKTGAVKARATSIQVDGQTKVTLANEKDAESVLSTVVDRFTADGEDIQYEFLDPVRMQKEQTSLEALKTTAEAVRLLISGQDEVKTYQVKDGDTAWGISKRLKLSIEDIEKANPGVKLDRIHPGDQLKLNKVEPLLHLQTARVVSETAVVAYGIREEKTDSLYEGERKIRSEGVTGEKIVTCEAIHVNGEMVEKKELESLVLKEPVDEVVLVGTKEKPASESLSGGGSLGRPMGSMNMSSGFGGSRNHKGGDYTNPVGTPVCAAESGVVTFAGRSGAYGNLIIISHGGGLTTYYAHLSTFSVSSGSRVSRGQMIGKVGMTGRTTGPHLHFEVRVNGTPKNPLHYF